jgi:phytoene/squalene synthetase
MRTNPKPLLETIADTVGEAQDQRVYGQYDYSAYPGDEPPYVVRHEPTNEIVERFSDHAAATALYERLKREHVAKEVLHAFMDWMQNDLYASMVKSGLRP